MSADMVVRHVQSYELILYLLLLPHLEATLYWIADRL